MVIMIIITVLMMTTMLIIPYNHDQSLDYVAEYMARGRLMPDVQGGS